MASAFFKSTLCSERALKFRNALTDKSVARNECVVWTGSTDIYGYGVYRVSVDGKRLKLLVHRLSYFIVKSPVPLCSDIHVSHLCHNKLCVNVAHLSYENASINNARKVYHLNGECTGHRGFQDCIFVENGKYQLASNHVAGWFCCCCYFMIVVVS